VLARIGDTRFHGPDCWYLPDDFACGFVETRTEDLLGFVLVAPSQSGTFQMGSADGDEGANYNEQPLHPVPIAEPFYMARWPVIVQQFGLFVKATHHHARGEWQRGLVNHPVVYTSWRDALAYCEWLDGQLRLAEALRVPAVLQDRLRNGWRITLPTEPQWEWAARGAARHVYPGGTRLTPDRANFNETSINATSAVGCFPDGASWCGVEEMAGGVWEWTRSKFQEYPYRQEDGRESLDGDGRRVVRGGSFSLNRRLVRCAYRYLPVPDTRSSYYGFRLVLSPFRS
jgi:formylglycine-generating enzyme required for sulfatase activity